MCPFHRSPDHKLHNISFCPERSLDSSVVCSNSSLDLRLPRAFAFPRLDVGLSLLDITHRALLLNGARLTKGLI